MQHIRLKLGIDRFAPAKGQETEIVYDLAKVINPHAAIIGTTGSGKSLTFRELLTSFGIQALGFQPAFMPHAHVFDTQDDMKIDDALMSSSDFTDLAEYGINPLYVSPMPNGGGPRRRIESFIRIINKTTHKLGVNQDAVLAQNLEELYRANGYYQEDPSTWGRRERQPGIDDLERWLAAKLRAARLGVDTKTHKALQAQEKAMKALRKEIVDAARDKNKKLKEDREAALNELVEDVLSNMRQALLNLDHVREVDSFVFKTDPETIQQVHRRVVAVRRMGVFKSKNPKFDPAKPVWRYGIKAYAESDDELKLFTFARCENIFTVAKNKGETTHIRDIIVLDEAHKFLDKDPLNILNIIAKEGRKYGVVLWLASQMPEHFSAEMIKCMGTKIILGPDEADWPHLIRNFQVPENHLKYIEPLVTATIQIKNKGEKASFRSTILERAIESSSHKIIYKRP